VPGGIRKLPRKVPPLARCEPGDRLRAEFKKLRNVAP
jgi:hypothetical protein